MLVDDGGQIFLVKARSYMTTVARRSSPALQRISAAAFTRHFLLAVLEGLNFLRTKSQFSEKQANNSEQRSILSSGATQALMRTDVYKRHPSDYKRAQKGEWNRPEQD